MTEYDYIRNEDVISERLTDSMKKGSFKSNCENIVDSNGKYNFSEILYKKQEEGEIPFLNNVNINLKNLHNRNISDIENGLAPSSEIYSNDIYQEHRIIISENQSRQRSLNEENLSENFDCSK